MRNVSTAAAGMPPLPARNAADQKMPRSRIAQRRQPCRRACIHHTPAVASLPVSVKCKKDEEYSSIHRGSHSYCDGRVRYNLRRESLCSRVSTPGSIQSQKLDRESARCGNSGLFLFRRRATNHTHRYSNTRQNLQFRICRRSQYSWLTSVRGELRQQRRIQADAPSDAPTTTTSLGRCHSPSHEASRKTAGAGM